MCTLPICALHYMYIIPQEAIFLEFPQRFIKHLCAQLIAKFSGCDFHPQEIQESKEGPITIVGATVI